MNTAPSLTALKPLFASAWHDAGARVFSTFDEQLESMGLEPAFFLFGSVAAVAGAFEDGGDAGSEEAGFGVGGGDVRGHDRQAGSVQQGLGLGFAQQLAPAAQHVVHDGADGGQIGHRAQRR